MANGVYKNAQFIYRLSEEEKNYSFQYEERAKEKFRKKIFNMAIEIK